MSEKETALSRILECDPLLEGDTFFTESSSETATVSLGEAGAGFFSRSTVDGSNAAEPSTIGVPSFEAFKEACFTTTAGVLPANQSDKT